MKRCKRCGTTKPLTDFYEHKEGRQGRRPECKDCFNAARKAYREANLETMRERDRKRYLRERERRIANARKYYAANSEAQKANRRAYYESNKLLWRTYKRSRRARWKDAFVEHVSFAEIVLRDVGVCGICGEQVMEATAELDHIIPLVAGGQHKQTNIQLSHRTCNRRKFTKLAA